MGHERGQPRSLAWVACLALLLASALLVPMAAKANGTMPGATAGVAYSFDVDGAASGRNQYSITDVYIGSGSTNIGQVPGLTMDPATGAIHGTPTSVGAYHVYWQLYDASLGWRGNEMWLTVSAPVITLSPSSLPQGTINSTYQQVLSVGGGTGPYSITLSGGALPAGVGLVGGQLQGTPTIGGTFSFAITVSDSSTGSGSPFSTTFNYTLVIAKNPQSVSFGAQPAQTFAPGGGFALDPLAIASSGLPVGYSSQTLQVCTIVGNTVTILAAGDCKIAASQAGNAIYAAAATVVRTIAVGKASQVITGFASDPAAPIYVPAGTFDISAIGGVSGQPVLFASGTPAVCSVNDDTVTVLSAGNCALMADQVGDANYTAAPQVTLDVVIGAASQAISNFVANPAAPVFAPGGTFSLSATGGGSTSPVVFATTSPATCVVGGNTVTMLAAGICALTAGQAADANYTAAPQVMLNVLIGAASQAITNFIANPAASVFAPNGKFRLSATGGASTSPVVFATTSPAVCSVSGSTVTLLAAGICALTADQAADANYSAAPQVTRNVMIGAASQAITNFVANPVAPVFAPKGTFSLSATGGASTRPVVFATTSPATCVVGGNTVTMLTAGICALTADQAGDGNYSAAPQVTRDVVIGASAQAISNFVANPAAPVFAPGGTFNLSATGGASTSPLVFATTSPAVCSVSGSTVTMLAADICALTADQAGDANYNAAQQLTLDVVIGAAAQAITNFTANPAAPVFAPDGTFSLSATGGASTNPVTFATTSPSTCTVAGNTVTMLAAGMCAVTADQAADANYSAAPQARIDVVISAATPTLSWSAPMEKIVGEADFELPIPDSTSSGEFTYSSSDTAVATVDSRTVTIVGPGVATLLATQAADGNYVAGTVGTTLTVGARPDPTGDPGVVDSLQAQADASRRFAAAQQGNIRDRLRQLRSGGGSNPSHNGLTLNMMGATGRSLSLPMGANGISSTSSGLSAGWGVWTAGSITVGERDSRNGSDGFDFRSDGISAGIDRKIGHWILGFAAGAGWDDTDFADGRSTTGADQRSLSGYGLWRGDNWFVDGLLGWGRLDFDIHRWSETAAATATATRSGDQAFGSLELGYERSGERSTLAGYGRYDGSHTRLDAYRESGLGAYDLEYRVQDIDSSSLALGVEGSYRWLWNGRVVRPTWMLEYREALSDDGTAAINFVLKPLASDYVLGLRNYGDSGFALGGGLDIEMGRGWQLTLSYRHENAGAVESDSVGLRLMLRP